LYWGGGSEKELLQNLGHYKSTLALVVEGRMMTKGRTFWEEMGNLVAGSTLEEAENFQQKASETWEADASMKALSPTGKSWW
jgi:hypothetical protein